MSIVIPALNREDVVVAALRSLLCQADAVDLDIVVVNGSTDRRRLRPDRRPHQPLPAA